MGIVEKIYESAARAGLLRQCRWRPSDGGPAQQHPVGFVAPNDTVLDGLGLSTEYAMSYPASVFAGLAAHEALEIDGVIYLVRGTRAVADGSEMRASLMRV